jgi:hypothetical protein
MLKLLRRLDTDTTATDARMSAAGYQVQATGRWSRTYRPSPELKAAWAQGGAQDQADQDLNSDLAGLAR